MKTLAFPRGDVLVFTSFPIHGASAPTSACPNFGLRESQPPHHLPRVTSVSMPTANKRGIATRPATGGPRAFPGVFRVKAPLLLHSAVFGRFQARKRVSVSEVKEALLHSDSFTQALLWRAFASFGNAAGTRVL